MRASKRVSIAFFSVLVGCVGCDHASKQIAASALAGTGGASFFGDLVRFELALNPGGFLSLGADLPEGVRHLLLVGLVPVLVALLCAKLLPGRATSPSSLLGVGLVAGGGLANWLDRLLHGGAVTDFVSLGVGHLRTGIFNLADLAVLAGVALLFLRAGAQRTEG